MLKQLTSWLAFAIAVTTVSKIIPPQAKIPDTEQVQSFVLVQAQASHIYR